MGIEAIRSSVKMFSFGFLGDVSRAKEEIERETSAGVVKRRLMAALGRSEQEEVTLLEPQKIKFLEKVFRLGVAVRNGTLALAALVAIKGDARPLPQDFSPPHPEVATVEPACPDLPGSPIEFKDPPLKTELKKSPQVINFPIVANQKPKEKSFAEQITIVNETYRGVTFPEFENNWANPENGVTKADVLTDMAWRFRVANSLRGISDFTENQIRLLNRVVETSSVEDYLVIFPDYLTEIDGLPQP